MSAIHGDGEATRPDENETSPLLRRRSQSQSSSNNVATAVAGSEVDKAKVKMAYLFPAVAIGVSADQPIDGRTT